MGNAGDGVHIYILQCLVVGSADKNLYALAIAGIYSIKQKLPAILCVPLSLLVILKYNTIMCHCSKVVLTNGKSLVLSTRITKFHDMNILCLLNILIFKFKFFL